MGNKTEEEMAKRADDAIRQAQEVLKHHRGVMQSLEGPEGERLEQASERLRREAVAREASPHKGLVRIGWAIVNGFLGVFVRILRLIRRPPGP